jgi:hypothetical protein
MVARVYHRGVTLLERLVRWLWGGTGRGGRWTPTGQRGGASFWPPALDGCYQTGPSRSISDSPSPNPSIPHILFTGVPLAGCSTTLARLGWDVDDRLWQKGPMPAVPLACRGRNLVAIRDYQGSWEVPPLHRPAQAAGDRDDLVRRVRELRRTALARVDGMVVVIDSQRGRLQASVERLRSLQLDLQCLGRVAADLPTVLFLNKRDLPIGDGRSPWHVVPEEQLLAALPWPRAEHVAGSAREGTGVLECLGVLLDAVAGARGARPYR